ncbi:YegS/Rv2252/BmrU family lipid kinase [Thermopolyspora sp. NPDC052614]|uniref:YegS/Rv2252/BmrU family lipid kinase n=1 Tax=Thermopolyspora sp. NPDC052614 TaxID=3155682 RepID=UPI0034266D01
MAGDLVVLVNPAARGGRGLRVLGPVLQRLRRGDRPVTVIVGVTAQDALERARAAVGEGPEALVAFGGDGLVHLAVQAVAGTPVPLGIIPAGTGNDIADALGVPRRDPLAAAEVVLRGRTATVDAGRIGPDRWFAGVVACGFDSRVNERANALTWPGGAARYLRAMVQELRVFRPIPFTITLDGKAAEREAMLVAVANTRSYGAGMRVCPDASPYDGLFDVLVVGALAKSEFLRIFPRVYRGGHVTHPAATITRARTVRLEAHDVVAYADGERVGPAPVDCAVEPGALSMIVP